MSDTPGKKIRHEQAASAAPRFGGEEEHGGGSRQKPRGLCRHGVIVGYDPLLDARADRLEALRCLAYLIRNDQGRPEKMVAYLDEVDYVLDRMSEDLRLSA